MRRVRVTVYGLFPTIFATCSSLKNYNEGCCQPNILREQLDEYPSNMLKNQDFLAELVAELYSFGNSIKLEIVNMDSAKGLWYAIRYRLDGNLAVIVDNTVFKGQALSPVKIRMYIEELLKTK